MSMPTTIPFRAPSQILADLHKAAAEQTEATAPIRLKRRMEINAIDKDAEARRAEVDRRYQPLIQAAAEPFRARLEALNAEAEAYLGRSDG